ncbi:hypothetical protein M9H77_18772 [Catharanthus roseus]|uniref:Uncharacterized protein n=1 Tax=Catharanthus roseus TaxID=4058 RepID=A0ACC0B8F2_CATRO|nr:hypothetical protein M9H77_18772 [Catharanthus roseus]
MISRSGVYYSSLVKEFLHQHYSKDNKDLITVKTTVKGVNVTLDRTLLSHIASIPNKGPIITFDSTTYVVLGAWKYNEASHIVGLHHRSNTSHSRTIWNTYDLSPRMRDVSNLISTNLAPRSRKSSNRVIDIYLIDKLLSSFPVNLPCIIIHCIRDTVSSNRKNHIFSFPLLLTDDEKEEIEDSGEEYDDSDSSIHAILEQMQIRQIQQSDALAGIQNTLQCQELMLTRIYGHLFPAKDLSGGGGGGGEGGLAL